MTETIGGLTGETSSGKIHLVKRVAQKARLAEAKQKKRVLRINLRETLREGKWKLKPFGPRGEETSPHTGKKNQEKGRGF